MTRLFPRAVPETLIALMFLGGACSPSSNVKSGAPVLTALSIVDSSNHNNHFADVTADTPSCAMGAAEGKDCDPGTAVCELDMNVVCKCVAKDMCDPSINPDAAVTGGTLNCTFQPLSAVLATFDRLLDTTPFTAGTTVATLTANPATAAKAATEYNSAGSPTSLVFTMFFNAPGGPSIVTSGDPAVPVDSTVTVALLKTLILAKDGKTQFTGSNLLADGKIAFKTSSFEASITVPAPPPPMSMGMGMMMMGCPDASMPPAGEPDGGTDAGGTSNDAGAADAGAPPTPPSTDVPADMNMGAITITFTNTVNKDVLDHIKITENGQSFTDFTTSMDTMFPTSTVKLVPNTMWKAGKTYVVTVDQDAADVLGAKLGPNGVAMASFTMSAI
jgi:hypothetical protein